MTFDKEYFNIGYLDRLSYQDSPVHRLDPRAKVITTILFAATVISCPKYEVISLVPFFIFPILLAALSDTPFLFIAKKVLVVSPFAIFIGIFNPFFDTRTVFLSDGLAVSAGWISFLSIMIKFSLTISASLLLIATTSFPGICNALQKMGAPPIFISQLLFLYRYLFVLMEEAMRMARARDLRAFSRKGTGIAVSVRLIGTLFVRTIERAERTYQAMLSRGFQGKIPLAAKYHFSLSDASFVFASAALFVLLRFFNVAVMIGRLVPGFSI